MQRCLKFRQTSCKIILEDFIFNTFGGLKTLLKNVMHPSQVIYNNTI